VGGGDVEVRDFAIVGGGPAGLHAALKAALLFHTAVLFDKGKKHGRIFFAPKVNNIPGFPGGISGAKLLAAQRRHIEVYEEEQGGRRFVEVVEPAEVVDIARAAPDEPFALTVRLVKTGETVVRRARAVIIATGVVDRQPYIGEWTARDIRPILPYANKGTVEYCLLCDGHTVAGKTVAVIGADRKAVGIAETLRDHFGANVTVVACVDCAPDAGGDAAAKMRASAGKRGLPILFQPIVSVHGLKEGRLGLDFADGSTAAFDKGFLSFGWFKMNNELAVRMGGQLDADGYVKTTSDCEVLDAAGEPIPRLFAIGDIRADAWKQIPSAFADAENAVIHAFAERL
jgi:thioredoxin reductase (NADPH)